MNVKNVTVILLVITIVSVTTYISKFTNDGESQVSGELIDVVEEMSSQIATLYTLNDSTKSSIADTKHQQEIILEKLNILLNNGSIDVINLDENKGTIADEQSTTKSMTSSPPKPTRPFENMSSEEVIMQTLMAQQLHDDKFYSESVDIEWAEKIDLKFNLLLENKELLGSKLISKECKSTSCRVEILHDSSKDADIFKKWFTWQGGYSSSTFDKNEKYITEYSLSR